MPSDPLVLCKHAPKRAWPALRRSASTRRTSSAKEEQNREQMAERQALSLPRPFILWR